MKYNTYFFLIFFTFSTATQAQEQASIQITGVVISADSLQQIPNVTVRIPVITS